MTSDQAIDKQPIKFWGCIEDFFNIWAVQAFLSIVTLGLYSPWAKIKRLQYYYASTEIGGTNFELKEVGSTFYRFQLLNTLLALSGFSALCLLLKLDEVQVIIAFFTLILTRKLALSSLPLYAIAYRIEISALRGISFKFQANKLVSYLLYCLPTVLAILFSSLFALYFPKAQLAEQSLLLSSWYPSLVLILLFCLSIPVLDFIGVKHFINNSSFGSSPLGYNYSFKENYIRYIPWISGAVLFSLLLAYLSSQLNDNAHIQSLLLNLAMALLTILFAAISTAYLCSIRYISTINHLQLAGKTITHTQNNLSGTTIFLTLNNLCIILSFGCLSAWANMRALKRLFSNSLVHIEGPLFEFIHRHE